MSDPRKEIIAQTADELARQMASQPALFSEFDGIDGFSPPPQAIQRYTGARSTLDEQRLLKVGALRLLGASDREIEQACHVTRRTIPVVLAELEKSGRITPLKQRLAMLTGENAERCNIVLRALLERVGQPGTKTAYVQGEAVEVETDGITMELAAMIKAVSTAMGISVEKYLLTTGQATEIVEQRSGAGREEIERWLKDAMPVQATVTSPPSESASAATPPVSEEIRGNEPARDGSGTATHEPDPKRLDAGQDPGADRGGGDASDAPPPKSPMG